MYLNRIPFGGTIYGIKAASIRYFGKENLKDLKLWEMATLAAMPKGPSRYNPLRNPELSKERRGVVLQLMYDQKKRLPRSKWTRLRSWITTTSRLKRSSVTRHSLIMRLVRLRTNSG
ncbi:transglycosylase domain-containing protein [Paenibacillus rhizoplanae]